MQSITIFTRGLVTITTLLTMTLATFVAGSAFAHTPGLTELKASPILMDLTLAKSLGLAVMAKDTNSNVAYLFATEKEQQEISRASHLLGRCAGFEALPNEEVSTRGISNILETLSELKDKNQTYMFGPFRAMDITVSPDVRQAVAQVSAARIEETIRWLSAFTSRVHTAADPNVHVRELKTKLETLLKESGRTYTIDLISHKSTKQQSLRVHLEGSHRPEEIIVLGGHLDSINQMGGKAPGADDNASGSADIFEALRITLGQPVTQRSLEFFWYAGEEGGLLGSAEIAKSYKAESKGVLAALQLDMTLFPGDGELTVGSMEDFTSAWLRDYFVQINNAYELGGKIVVDKCGYGCSDHASWHRNGFPALMPFEATMDSMNGSIHSAKDVVGPQSNFKHAAYFAKVAVVFALDLGNSEAPSAVLIAMRIIETVLADFLSFSR